jgi:cytosine/adenosine deaminase-related metal-dependent hydrolase
LARTLIRNGWVVTVDPALGELRGGDILIEDGLIREISRGLKVGDDVEIIDATDLLVMPGFVNAHHHLWQTGLRSLAGNWTSPDYHRNVHGNIAPRYQPHDSYLGGLIGALGQIDGGTTTVLDWCHNNATPDHTDASIDALEEAGIRAVFGHGSVKPPTQEGGKPFSEVPHPRGDAERVRKGRLAADDALVTMALAIKGPDYSTIDVTLQDFQLAHDLDLLSSAHVWNKASRVAKEGYAVVAAAGLLGPDHNVVHANCSDAAEFEVFFDAGVTFTATPACELQSNDVSIIGRVLAGGFAPSLGPDTELYLSGDMFQVMRHALQTQRMADNGARVAAGEAIDGVSVGARQALEWATIEGARALRMDARTGSLTPGKQADLLLLRATDLNLAPVHDPVNAIVFYATAANIDTVMIGGQVVKRDGKLHYDPKLRVEKQAALAASAERLFAEAAYAHAAA